MTVLEKDLEQHFDLLRRKVNDLAPRLPQGCYSPVVIDDMMDVYGIFYSLTADGYVIRRCTSMPNISVGSYSG